MDDKIYQEELLEHFKYPKNRKNILDPDFSSGEYNPSCGDKIAIEGKISSDGVIIDLGFSGSGCVISQATASMLTDSCIGKTIDQVLALSREDIIKIVGIQLGPTRMKCALLSLLVLQEGLKDYKEKTDKGSI